ncbi:AcrR family transcriptional regulator [Anoxybacillus voinovskiensis]|uniref:AcrR family transcriptional regulator n=1 Tax=Anoxybacteroides voinovskiense TaxID=230470 RepID=A0A840DTL3_9BACL|nr:AcrR family transcriptional regulator [Anoxybacillus voinovskiensis]GGJ57606.1 TetR family transcriptional regulator [Anoxybacillus voinovskiensis]
MYSSFEKQPEEKKKLIIRVAIEEFVQHGYDRASTDVITSRAGISKGILFHYFKSKKNLYLYVVTYAKNLLSEKVMEALQRISSTDFFARVKEIALAKQRVLAQYPYEAKLAVAAMLTPPAAVKKEMEELLKQHYETYEEAFMLEHIFLKQLIPTEKLRDDVSVDTVIQMTMAIVDHVSQKYQKQYQMKPFDFLHHSDSILKELDDYFRIIQYGIYKTVDEKE